VRLALILSLLVLTGCNSPGVIKQPTYPEVMPLKCADGRFVFINPNKPYKCG
jgi:hypothetical protein